MAEPVTVAVIDGNAGARRMLGRRLARSPGIAVVAEAGDPAEALAVLEARQPQVVVIDLRGMDAAGAGLLARLGAAAPGAGVVVLTAYVTAGERADLARAGARAVLLKEIDSGALVRTIRTVAGRTEAPGTEADGGTERGWSRTR